MQHPSSEQQQHDNPPPQDVEGRNQRKQEPQQQQGDQEEQQLPQQQQENVALDEAGIMAPIDTLQYHPSGMHMPTAIRMAQGVAAAARTSATGTLPNGGHGGVTHPSMMHHYIPHDLHAQHQYHHLHHQQQQQQQQQQHQQHPHHHPPVPSMIGIGATTGGTPSFTPSSDMTAIQHQLAGMVVTTSEGLTYDAAATAGGQFSDHADDEHDNTHEFAAAAAAAFEGGEGDDIDAGEEEEEEEDEEDDEGPPVKLFVGQVPKSMSEEDIFPTFNEFGPLKDVSIIRDKHTGLHRGCAFVTYWSQADAQKAQDTLHNQFTFPKGRKPVQVKPAEPTEPENKLFIGMLSRKAGEKQVRDLFAPYGEIKEIYMIRSADGTSKCAAFLRYTSRESALAAIEALHNKIVMEGSTRPLIVKFADTKQQRQARHARNSRREALMAAMTGPAGYPGYQQMPQGPPPMGLPPPHAGQYSMPQYSGAYHGAPAGGPQPPPPPHHPYMYSPHQYGPPPAAAGVGPYGYPSRQDPGMRAPNPRPREGPTGANLFIYHLPHDLTDADLATAFTPFGNVISAKVYVDKYTGESKGFGFVSYDSVASAEQAIEQMNGFQIGNKRLKVQHKRVGGAAGGSGGGSQQHRSSGDESLGVSSDDKQSAG